MERFRWLISFARLLKGHKMAVATAFIVGIAFGLPHIVIPLLQDPDVSYTPLTSKTTLKEDDALYAALIREVHDGHCIVNDVYLYEHKSSPNAVGWGAGAVDIFLAGVTFLTGSVTNTFILGSFLFPIVIFLLTYLLLNRWTRDRFLSVAGSTVMLLGVHIVRARILLDWSCLQHLIPIVRSTMDPVTQLNNFARMPAIQFVFIEFVVALWLFYEALQRRSKSYSVCAGIVFGLLFYSYFYHWTLFLVGTVLLLFLFYLNKQYEQARCLVLILIIGLVISSPLLAVIGYLHSGPNFELLSSRLGVQFGRYLEFWSWPYLVFGLLLIILGLRDRGRVESLLMGALLMGGVACLNAQVVLGYTLHPSHWRGRALDPLMIIVWTYLIARIMSATFEKRLIAKGMSVVRSSIRYLGLVLSGLFIVYACITNVAYSRNTYQYQTLPPAIIDAYAWLDRNTQRDDVIVSLSIENTILIPVYTHNNVLLPYACGTTASEDEILDRLYIGYRLFNVPSSYVADLLNQDNASVTWALELIATKRPDVDSYEKVFWNPVFFGFRYRFSPEYMPSQYDYAPHVKEAVRNGRKFFHIPLDLRQRILSEYTSYPSDVNELLNKYRIDYLYYGPYEKSIAQMNPSEVPWLREVYSNASVEIYKVLK